MDVSSGAPQVKYHVGQVQERYNSHRVQYNYLASLISPSQGTGHTTTTGAKGYNNEAPPQAKPHPSFAQMYEQEAFRVKRFVEAATEQLWGRTVAAAQQLLVGCAHGQEGGEPATSGAAAGVDAGQVLGMVEAECDSVAEELVVLDIFVRENVAALAHVAHLARHDISCFAPPPTHPSSCHPIPSTTISTGSTTNTTSATSGGGTRTTFTNSRSGSRRSCSDSDDQAEPPAVTVQQYQEYQTYVEGLILRHGSFGPVLVLLSDVYEHMRHLRLRQAASEAVWTAPDEFRRSTTKYWVHPSDLMQVKTTILRHLPILLYGRQPSQLSSCSTTAGDGTVPDFEEMRKQGLQECSQVASVYLDNALLDTYHERLRRDDGAALVRVRWYGARTDKGEQQLYVERKVHRESWSGECSTKSRAPILQRDVAAYLQGQGGPPELLERTGKWELLQLVQDQLVATGQEPYMRTEYWRTAFQVSDSNAVRISIDQGMRLLREAGAPRATGGWCREEGGEVAEEDVVRFPYAILDIKVQEGEVPAWVEELKASGLLVEAPKFSKFLHGMALLFPHAVRNTPHWFLPDGRGYSSPATIEELRDPATTYQGQVGDHCELPAWCQAAAGPGGMAAQYSSATAQDVSSTEEAQRSSSSAKEHSGAAVLQQRSASVHMEVVVDAAKELSRQEKGASALQQVVVLREDDTAATASADQGWLSGRIGGTSAAGSRPLWRLPILVEPVNSPAGSSNPRKAQTATSPSPHPTHPTPATPPHKPPARPLPRAEPFVRTRVEPKTYFANERTFLAWLTISVMVMFLALSLLGSGGSGGGGSSIMLGGVGEGAGGAPPTPTAAGGGCHGGSLECKGSQVAGALIAPVALLFMAYSLHMYRRRTRQIMNREATRYDDQQGPVLLTALLLLAMLLAYIITMRGLA